MARFSVLDLPTDGTVVVGGGELVHPPPEGTLRWIDLEAQDVAALAILGERFGFHPLAIEDCAHEDQRPKLEEYEASLFIVAHAFTLTAGCDDVSVAEVHCFLARGTLVTVHLHPVPLLDDLRRRLVAEPVRIRRGPDFLLHAVLDSLVDAIFAHLDHISDALEELETAVIHHPDQKDLERIFAVKHVIATVRRVLGPLRDVVATLARPDNPYVSSRAAVYFRDVHDHAMRIVERLEVARDLIGNCVDAYRSSVANHTNEVIKRLTLVSAIFLPLTFVTGFFGQNFDHLPIHGYALLLTVCALVFLLPPTLWIWFRKKNWW